MTETVLSRLSSHTLASYAEPSSAQSQVDGLVSGFLEQASDWRSLAAMSIGGLAYRFGRIGTMALASRAGQAASLIQTASYGIGLSAEVLAFETSHRSLLGLSGEGASNPNLWRWNGRGGFREGLANSFVSFGTLKFAGHLAEGQNVILQHFVQDTGMVLGHHATAALGISPGPEGTLAQQFLHAEITNLQLSFGMSLVHTFAPGLPALERGLELTLRTPQTEGRSSFFDSEGEGAPWALATGQRGNLEGRRSGDRVFPEKGPLIVAMSSIHDKDKPDGPADSGFPTNRDAPATTTMVGGPPELAGKDSPPSPPRPATPPADPKLATTLDAPAAEVVEQRPEIPPPSPAASPAKDPQEAQTRVAVPVPRQKAAPSPAPEAPQDPTDVDHDTRKEAQSLVTRLPPEETGLQVGMELEGRYQVLDYLGSGGYGHVIKVRDLQLERLAVIKVPRPERDRSQKDTVEVDARFRNEVKITANMDRRHVVVIYDFITLPNGRTVPVMEYLPGNDLSDVMSTLSAQRKLDIFLRICEGIESAHRDGIVHRDLKPGNIRITDTGEVRIVDWGLAKAFEELPAEPRPEVSPELFHRLEKDITLVGVSFGTPGYIAPERFLNRKIENPRSIDVFALGAILYEMITGQNPFTHGRNGSQARFFSTHPDFFLQPPAFRDVIQGDYPLELYDKIEEVCRRALDPDPTRRFESAGKLREALLLVWGRAEMIRIRRLLERRRSLEQELHAAWSEYRTDRPITEDLEKRMLDPLYALKNIPAAFDQAVESAVQELRRLTDSDPVPEARKMIAELSWMRLVNADNTMPDEVRQTLIDRIREYDVATENERTTSMKDALEGQIRVQLKISDHLNPQMTPENVQARVIPIEEYEKDYFREGAPLLEGNLSDIQDRLNLPAGYYVLELSHPDYAFMRYPLRITLPQVRQGILNRGSATRGSLNLNLRLTPPVPEGFSLVHGGKGVIGHNIYRFDDPALVISFPERPHSFNTFAISNPITVGEYRLFIESQLRGINHLVGQGRFEEAFRHIERLRNLIPRDQPRISPRNLPENPDWESVLATAFEGARFHWRIRSEGEGQNRIFTLADPTSHPSLRGDPILNNQPIHAIPYRAADAYRYWRSVRDRRNYKIVSAEQKEIAARNTFDWSFPWGYRYRRTFFASRLVHADLDKGTHSHPIGTHPLGPDLYRDFSIFGYRDAQGRIQRLLDLIGNVREFTSTVAENDAIVMSGASVRTPSGNQPLPCSRTYVHMDVADEYNGTFRLVIEFPPP
ncbi:MAG: bifunctional serine/threonine-protein kinase/formylglycine-generating enzyme family protein [bacterium]